MLTPGRLFGVTGADDVTISVGDSVRWDNDGGGTHNVVWDGGAFPSNGDASTSAWSHTQTFNSAGTWNYYCIIHGNEGLQGMSGTVTVNP